jgi:serine/threonine protein kinase
MAESHVVSLARFEKVRAIGVGSFGKSYLTQSKTQPSFYVVKTIPDVSMEPTPLSAHLERLCNVQHPAVLAVSGYSLPVPAKKRPLAVLTPFLSDGSLAALLESRREIKNVTRLKVLFGVAEGIRHLYHLQIPHRGLTLTNVLLTSRLEPKVCDFGLAEFRPTKVPSFAVPFNARQSDQSVDCFCFGAIAYTLLRADLLRATRSRCSPIPSPTASSM